MAASDLCVAMSEAGLGVVPSVKVDEKSGDIAYTVCQGDLCERRKVKAGSGAGQPDGRLVWRLLTQPIALAAIFGMALLAAITCFDAGATGDALLSLVGGRDNGRLILKYACYAHIGEGLVALVLSAGPLGFSPAAACRFWVLVTIVGFPILHHELALRRIHRPKASP
jgi:hypothetical protein